MYSFLSRDVRSLLLGPEDTQDPILYGDPFLSGLPLFSYITKGRSLSVLLPTSQVDRNPHSRTVTSVVVDR